jgi:lambda family phage minor tail protein L
MTTNAKIKTDIQNLLPGQLIELYNLVSVDGLTTYNFCNGTISGSNVVFDSITYSAIPCETEGFEQGNSGKQARPKIRISNIYLTFVATNAVYNDMVGWKLTRRRTFVKYLDGQPGADSSAQFPADDYYVFRKTSQTKYEIEYELSSALEFGSRKVPSKQVLEMCQWRYRSYINSAFTNASTNYATEVDPIIQCPYKGTTYFNANNATTLVAAEDDCSHTVKGCKLRQAAALTANPNDAQWQALPYGGFPNVAKFRRSNY